jgi:hypothetical protein
LGIANIAILGDLAAAIAPRADCAATDMTAGNKAGSQRSFLENENQKTFHLSP